MTEAILRLWNEAHSAIYIALKLGIRDEEGEPDVEKVMDVVEAPGNYVTT